jgi:hypothetical protein
MGRATASTMVRAITTALELTPITMVRITGITIIGTTTIGTGSRSPEDCSGLFAGVPSMIDSLEVEVLYPA